ncbi:hypothetical protein OKW49_002900 [Paraburkholderia youngii]|uniref:sensor histidine kinase n=1 Tax=Paraburkholderia youngii TaxID=2782701 RepID=UPI003D22285B
MRTVSMHCISLFLPPNPVTVHAAVIRLTQVVCNLLFNAVKYTPSGGGISLTVEAPGFSSEPAHGDSSDDAGITVKNNGAGIPASLLPQVCEMFTQSASARKRATGSLGIGLAVVKHPLTAHNGTVTIASADEGQGAEITLRLSIVCASVVDRRCAARGRPKHILLVDDSADATEALGKLLRLRAPCAPAKLVALSGSKRATACPQPTNRCSTLFSSSRCHSRTSRWSCGVSANV